VRPFPRSRRPVVLCALLALGLSGALSLCGQEKSEKHIVVLPIKTVTGKLLEGEMIDPGIAAFFERAVSQINPDEVAAVVVDLNTFGGRVDSMVRICDALEPESCPVPTVAFVNNKAISAGAGIAITCKRIYMTPEASMGASTPVIQGKDEIEAADEKILSFVRAEFRARAGKRDRNTAIAEAMVDPNIEVVEIKVGPDRQFVTREEFESLANEARMEADKPEVAMVGVVSPKGSVLTLTAKKAEDYKFIDGIAETLEDVKKELDLVGVAVVEWEPNWSEELARFITHPVIRSILLLVGLACIYTEAKVPGIGLPTLGAIIAFGLLFFGHHAAGLASVVEILLFVAGIGLILAEIFLIPGFGVTGVSGIALVLVSLVMIFTHRVVPEPGNPIQWRALGGAISNVGVGFIGSILVAMLVFFFLSKFLPKVPVANRLMNVVSLSEQTPLEAEGAGSALVGRTGRCLSMLRPAGKALFDDDLYDVVTEGDFIAKKRLVTVVRVDGRRIVVREAEKDA